MKLRYVFVALLLALAAVLPASAQTTIQFSTWDSGPLADYWSSKITEFEAKNPDIKIDHLINPDQYESKIFTLIAADSAPDVMALFEVTTPLLTERGNLVNLNSFIEDDPDFDLTDFVPSTLELAEYNGGLYGLGSDVNPQILYYNTDLFEAAGVPLPKADWTWEDLKGAAEKLTIENNENGVEQWGVGWFWQPSGAWWVPAIIQIWNNGGDFYNEERAEVLVNEPAAVGALQYWADMIADGLSPGATDLGGTTPAALFQQGRLAMYLDGTWNIASFQEVPFEWDIAPIPGNVEDTTFLHASYYGISSQSENPEAAWRWVKFLVSPEIQLDRSELVRYIPTRASVDASKPYVKEDAPPTNASILGNVVSTARMAPVAPNNNRLLQVFERELTLLYLGEKSAQEAMDTAAQEMNRLISR